MRTSSTLTLQRRGIFSRLYHGDTDFDFVGHTRRWVTISLVVILAGVVALLVRGLNLGIDFVGGTVWEVESGGLSVTEVRDELAGVDLEGAKVQTVSSDEGERIRVQAEPLDDPDAAATQRQDATALLAEITGSDPDDVSVNSVGPTWGAELSRKALIALVVFLAAIMLYISLRLEFKMAITTVLGLVHDVLVTVGVYAITGFDVTPATVTAVLTILGFSIYDGIVVFDKVDENTRLVSSTRMTYSDMVNLSLNQTLMRSLNTSVTAVLPVTSLLVVGSFVLGAATLEEFALALLVGLLSGVYSSIFIASPMLAWLKEREPRYRDVRRRMEARDAKGDRAEPGERAGVAAEAVGAAEADAADERVPATTGARSSAATDTRPSASGSGVIPPRPRKKTPRRR
ncbi:MAG: protein translocase subunit SecF [Acidimicrobiales bacterium]